MRNFCLILMLFVGVNAFAASGSGNVSSIFQLGGSNGVSSGASAPINLPVGSAGIKTYYVQSNGGAANAGFTAQHYYSLAKQGGVTGQWSVPSGKIAVCMQQQYTSNNSVAPLTFIQFGYATASFSNDATTVTGGNCYSGAVGNCTDLRDGGLPIYTPTANIAPVTYNYPIIFDASSTGANATIYPFIRMFAAQVSEFGMLCTETP